MARGVTQGIPAATQALEARTSQLTAQGEHVILVFGVPVDFDGQIGPWPSARIDRAAQVAWDDTAADALVSGAAVQNRHVEAHAMATGLVAPALKGAASSSSRLPRPLSTMSPLAASSCAP